MYTMDYVIASSDVDFNQNLKLSSLLRIYQDIGMVHADMLGLGKDKMLDKGLIWIISRMSTVVTRMPKYTEKVIIETAPGTPMRVIMPRFYRVLDENRNELIRSVGLWSVVDYNTRSLVDPASHNIGFEEKDIENLENTPAVAVKKLSYTECATKKVEYSDLDLNGHMNNTKYSDVIMNVLNNTGIKNYQIKEYNISYFKEAKHLEEIKLDYVKEDGYINVFGTIDNQKIFAGEIKYIL